MQPRRGEVVSSRGFEPPTSSFGGKRSIQLSYEGATIRLVSLYYKHNDLVNRGADKDSARISREVFSLARRAASVRRPTEIIRRYCVPIKTPPARLTIVKKLLKPASTTREGLRRCARRETKLFHLRSFSSAPRISRASGIETTPIARSPIMARMSFFQKGQPPMPEIVSIVACDTDPNTPKENSQ